MFGGFTEGLQLFASFAMLMNFPRFNKMKGMGQIVSWSVRDESLHCEGIIKLFHAFVKERDCLTHAVKDAIIDVCQKTVRLEDAFIDLAFEQGPVEGMTPKEIKKYIRYIADWRLGQLGLRADLHGRRAPAALARAAAQRRRARQFLRNPRDRIFEGRDAGQLERGVGQLRPPAEGQGGERCAGRRQRRRGYVRSGWGGGGVVAPKRPILALVFPCSIC